MQLSKPKVGLILLRAEWFDSVVALPELIETATSDAQAIMTALSEPFQVAGPWVVNSAESLAQVETALKTTRVDLVVMVFQVWAEDFYLIPLLRAVGNRPLAVWCYLPWEHPPRPASFVDVLRGSGPVGTLEGLGVVRNLGVDFTFTAGSPDNPRVVDDLTRAAQAGQIRRALREARFGVLPYRNEQMQTTFVDEFRLRAELGPTVELISVGELAQTVEGLTEREVDAYLADLKRHFAVRGVRDETLAVAARASLGLAHLAADRRLDVISLNDIAPELHDVLGLRPCLYPPLLDKANVLVGIEGDLGAATAMFILNRLTGSPILFAEIWFWDEGENLVTAGHAGPQNPAVAHPDSVWISHDFEFAQSDRTEGAHLQFVARPGPITLFQLRGTPAGWQAIATVGAAMEAEPWVEGYPHAVIQLDVPVNHFLNDVAAVGSTQHWALAYGDALADTAAVCDLLGIRLQAIS
ncbi:MAG: hypothetical protein ACE5I2_04665 [Anaerolineae bacterium]